MTPEIHRIIASMSPIELAKLHSIGGYIPPSRRHLLAEGMELLRREKRSQRARGAERERDAMKVGAAA